MEKANYSDSPLCVCISPPVRFCRTGLKDAVVEKVSGNCPKCGKPAERHVTVILPAKLTTDEWINYIKS